MKRLLIGTVAALAIGLTGAPAQAGASPTTDCYTQDTYSGGTRTTCYTGYPDYRRIITECDGNGHCTIRLN